MPVVNYLWNPLNDNIVREFDDAGTVIAEYTTEANQFGNVVSQRRNGVDSVYHYDGQGSTLALTDANGDVTDTYQPVDKVPEVGFASMVFFGIHAASTRARMSFSTGCYAYSPFGEVTARTGSTVNPFQYVGQKQYYRDAETGEYEVRRRPLSAEDGRWLSADPLQLPVQADPYVYAQNSPLRYIDPSGLKPCQDPPEPKSTCASSKDLGRKYVVRQLSCDKIVLEWAVHWVTCYFFVPYLKSKTIIVNREIQFTCIKDETGFSYRWFMLRWDEGQPGYGLYPVDVTEK